MKKTGYIFAYRGCVYCFETFDEVMTKIKALCEKDRPKRYSYCPTLYGYGTIQSREKTPPELDPYYIKLERLFLQKEIEEIAIYFPRGTYYE